MSYLLITCFLFSSLPAWAGTYAGIVINKDTNQLGYYEGGKLVNSFSVATGRKADYTPEGEFKIVKKLVNPYYSKGKIPGGSPRNPLGVRWLGLAVGNTGGGTYGIHGTNNPKSIGTYASAGCIRMHNKDVIWLYDHSPLNTHVKIGRWKELPKTAVFEETLALEINSKAVSGANKVYSRNGETWIILRDSAQGLGYKVSWEQSTQSVVLSKGQRILISNPERDITKLNNISYSTPIIIRNNQTYVTKTFIESFLLAKVEISEQKVVIHNTPAP